MLHVHVIDFSHRCHYNGVHLLRKSVSSALPGCPCAAERRGGGAGEGGQCARCCTCKCIDSLRPQLSLVTTMGCTGLRSRSLSSSLFVFLTSPGGTTELQTDRGEGWGQGGCFRHAARVSVSISPTTVLTEPLHYVYWLVILTFTVFYFGIKSYCIYLSNFG